MIQNSHRNNKHSDRMEASNFRKECLQNGRIQTGDTMRQHYKIGGKKT